MIGRPTDYRPEFCEDIVQFCAEGNSLTAWCAKVGIARQTLYRWLDTQPAFCDAVSRARVAACTWWESQVKAGLQDRNFNTRAAEFMMGNQFRDEYGPQVQRVEIEHKGQVNVRSLTRDELVRLASQVVDVEEVKPLELAQGGQTGETDNANETPSVD